MVNPLNDVKSCIEDKISPDKESDYMKNYKPFISEGVVSLVGDKSSSQKVKIENVLVSGVEMGVLGVPHQEVNIKSSLINGNIVIGMRPSLPVEQYH